MTRLPTIALAALLAILARPEPAQCQGCYSGPCTSSIVCGGGCVCLKRGMDLEGQCWSVAEMEVE